MKASTPQLRALLATGQFVYSDIWTITLNGGRVIRWSGADVPVIANGQTYELGPAIDRGSITEKIGLEVATLVLDIDAGDEDLINSVPVIEFIAGRGLDGANVKLERAFRPSWDEPVTGTVIRFSGRVTSVGEVKSSHAEVTISAWTVLLNVNVPPELYQTGCLHTVYDTGCGLEPEAFAASGTISAGATELGFGSGLTAAAGLYSQGRVSFLTGVNAGLSRSVKSSDGSGNIALIEALPAAPVAGDTFRIYAGCDLTMATCRTRFNNLQRFKGTPFVPIPETST